MDDIDQELVVGAELPAASGMAPEENGYGQLKRIQLKPGSPEDCRLESNREPLYKRLPTHDEDGELLTDFMMLIPGLKNLPAPHFESCLAVLHGLLRRHEDVVFADLNTPLNLLWVSLKARHGAISELAAEIRLRIPEARLVGHTVVHKQPVDSPVPARFEGVRANLRRFLGR